MNSKGFIEEPDNLTQCITWVKEIVERAEKDALNIKKEEFDVCNRILVKLEEKVSVMESSEAKWECVKSTLGKASINALMKENLLEIK